jgi:ApaG protein
METLITAGVEVNVETFYQQGYSNPGHNDFMFAYHITIYNHNNFTVQLLRRRWEITNANGDTEVVEGDGVVGRQPVLYPGDSYQYVSGSNIQTPIGKMDGTYTFENKSNGKEFEVKIPVFKLVVPFVLN